MLGEVANCLLLNFAEAENCALLVLLARDVPQQITTLCLNTYRDLTVRVTSLLVWLLPVQ